VTPEAELRAAVQAWIADDPDPGDRTELQTLLDRAVPAANAHLAGTGGTGSETGAGREADAKVGAGGGAEAGGDPEAIAELRDRFGDRLHFGTAGLRGVVAAGPNRMNRAVVRAATAAVAGWLTEAGGAGQGSAAGRVGAGPGGVGVGPGGGVGAGQGSAGGVVVGCDARHRSGEFADEVAGVLAGAGIRVHLLPRPGPTPLLAFAVRYLGTAAGVMITASHNPAADNGYKLYLSDGAQVIPPADAEIEKRIAALGPLSQIPVAPADSPLITRHGDEIAQAYLAALVAAAGPAEDAGPELNVVYTAMHGVAGQLMLRAMRLAGFAAPHLVAAQAEPDPDFPTVAFPNPEEPGALDLALADARRLGADLVVASDPDGDRLAVAVPDPDGGRRAGQDPDGGRRAGQDPDGGRRAGQDSAAGWRVLTGDQVGALLGASLLEQTAGQAAPEARLVATTVVSSTLLSKIAAAAGVRYAETLTGFKWIARAADRVPGARFVFGYEEALGYVVGDVVRDKDGFGAALAMLRLAATAKSAARSVLNVYDDLERAHGVHLTSQLTLRTDSQEQVMSRLRSAPPAAFGGEPVTGRSDLAEGSGDVPPADVLTFRLAGGRVVLRPSGTEPKIKCYIELTEPLAGRSLAAARQAASVRLGPLRSALGELLAGV
jgi:phosphomannomutase